MRRFDPTSWPQHRPDLGSTSASKAPTSAQLPFGSNFGPSGGPCGFKMEDIAGPIRNRVFFAVDNASFEAMFPYVPHVLSVLGPTWCEAVAERCQVAAC